MTFKVEFLEKQEEETCEFFKAAYARLITTRNAATKWTIDRENKMILKFDFSGHTIDDYNQIAWIFIDNNDSHHLTTITLSDEQDKINKSRTLIYKIKYYSKNGENSTISIEDHKKIEDALSAEGRSFLFNPEYFKSCKATLII